MARAITVLQGWTIAAATATIPDRDGGARSVPRLGRGNARAFTFGWCNMFSFRTAVPRQLTGDLIALTGLLALAFALRLLTIWTGPRNYHPDETFQYLEAAHRLAFGSGVVPWEYIDGVRSWVLPFVIATIMRGAAVVSDHPAVLIGAVRCAAVILSLSVVVVAFKIARKRDSLAAATVAGFFTAIWFEPVYFSAAILTEVIAAHLLIIAAGVVHALEKTTPEQATRRVIVASVLVGVVFVIRYQYAPGIAVLMLWALRVNVALWWRALLAASLVAVVLGGLVDWLTLGSPFQSIWRNFQVNAVLGVATHFGSEPFHYFIRQAGWTWQWGILLTPLALLGMRRFPALACAALAVLIAHNLVAHKEYRHIFFTLASMAILIGLGLSTVIEAMRQRLAPRTVMGFSLAGCAALAGLSWFNAVSGIMPRRWDSHRANLRAFFAAHELASMCGLAVRGIQLENTGGAVYLHRDVPIYFELHVPEDQSVLAHHVTRWRALRDHQEAPRYTGADLSQKSALYNVAIAPDGYQQPGFIRQTCFGNGNIGLGRYGEICLWSRAGGCE